MHLGRSSQLAWKFDDGKDVFPSRIVTFPRALDEGRTMTVGQEMFKAT